MSEETIIDFSDLKVKHLSEQYMNLPSAPEPDDILYWCKSKKKKQFNTHDLIRVFGADKLEQIEKTMQWLDFNNYTKILDKEQWIDPESMQWFFHPESDSFSRMQWQEAEGQIEIEHIGLSTTENEEEAKELLKKLHNGEQVDDGSITISKYELLKNG